MRRTAFTIIELLVVLAIIGILIAAASLGFSAARRTGRDAQRMGDVLSISKAVDQSAAANSRYPGDWKCAETNCQGRTYESNTSSPEVILVKGQTPLATGLFRNGTIPTDPAPVYARSATPIDGDQVWPSWGYIYHSHYLNAYLPQGPAMVPQANQAYALKLDYLIEFDLENALPADITAFTPVSTTNHRPPTYFGAINEPYPASRHAYYFAGPYCGDTCYGSN